MKLNQIVYVVANAKSEVVLGVYNNYYEALNAIEGCNSADVSITPVLVDAPVDQYRAMCYSENTASQLVKEEIIYAYDLEEEAESDEDEDEGDDEYDDEYSDEDEDEDDEDEVDEKSEILDAVGEAIDRIRETIDDLLSELRD